MNKIIIRSIIISLLLAVILTVIGDFIFTHISSYSMKTDDWEKMYNMNYKDAMQYMEQHRIEVPPDSIIQTYQDPVLLKAKFKLFSLLFVGIFAGCTLIVYSLDKNKNSENRNYS